MTIRLSAYLVSGPFAKGLDEKRILESAYTGYYGLQDYAIFSWEKHVGLSLKHEAQLCSETQNILQRKLYALLDRLGLDSELDCTSGDLEGIAASFDSGGLESCSPPLEELSSAIRAVTERIRPQDLDSRARHSFLLLNGEPQYKCPKPQCRLFSYGFESEEARDFHAAEHSREFTCDIDGCPRRTVGFTSSKDLEQHTKQAHYCRLKPGDIFPSFKKPMDLWSACEIGDVEAVKAFHEDGFKLNITRSGSGSFTPMMIAVRNGHLGLCQYLIANGCKPLGRIRSHKSHGATFLREAMRLGDKDMFRMLLNYATETARHLFANSDDIFPHIEEAMRTGDPEILESILAVTSHRKEKLRFSEIFLLAIYDYRISKMHKPQPSLYEYLFSLASPEEACIILGKTGWEELPHESYIRSRVGGNLLHYACSRYNEQAIAFLLRRMEKRDIHALDHLGKTALGRLKFWSGVTCLKIFFEHDNMIVGTICDNRGNLPIHKACVEAEQDAFEFLLRHSLEYLNVENADGATPLHCALYQEVVSSLQVSSLLKTGACDLTKRDKAGWTAHDLARNHPYILVLFEYAEASAASVSSGPV